MQAAARGDESSYIEELGRESTEKWVGVRFSGPVLPSFVSPYTPHLSTLTTLLQNFV
jgi:hypothetical protein